MTYIAGALSYEGEKFSDTESDPKRSIKIKEMRLILFSCIKLL